MSLNFVTVYPNAPNALGATLGQDVMASIDAELTRASAADVAVILDLKGVGAVNASFLKSTVFWAFQCGQAEVHQRKTLSPGPWAVRALRLFPMVSGCSEEVATDIGEFFSGRGIPILHVDNRSQTEILSGRVLGAAEPIAARTLSALCENGAGTAAELAERSQDQISVTGWNNRLVYLYLHRLATRQRKGKFWIYRPTARKVSLWD